MENIHSEKVGRFTIRVSYDEFSQGPNEHSGTLLYANNRNFHVMKVGKLSYKHLIDVINDNQTSKFFFVKWNLYSSASNPVLREMSQGYTLDDIKKEFVSKAKTDGWYEGMDDEEILQHFDSSADIENDCGDVMIVAESEEDAKNSLSDWKAYFEGCWEYSIEDEEGEIVDGCSGYFGDYEEECLKDARNAAKMLEEEELKKDALLQQEAKAGSVTMDTKLKELLLSENEQVKRLAKGIYKEITR